MTVVMTAALSLRFELLALAQKVGNLAEDAAGTPAAGILLALNRDMHAAVRAVDRLPMNVELLGKSPEVVEAGRRLIAALADRCPRCGCTLERTPGAASRTHDGPRLDLLECTNPTCDHAEAVDEPVVDRQAIFENRRRMAHEQACADLKRLEDEGGSYEEIRAAKMREERLSYAE